jgi:glucokinase
MTPIHGTYYIGVDIGGTNLRLALVDSRGGVAAREKLQTDIHLGRDGFLDRLLSGISMLRVRGEQSGGRVSAAGIGVPGLIDASGLVLSSVNLRSIEGLNLKEMVARSSGLPIVTVNDANAAAYGEKMYGAGRDYGSLMLLTLGTGVGSGLVLDGKLWTGADGIAAECGHVTVEPDGIRCSCGNRGCLEQYASARAIVAAAVRALAAGARGALDSLSGDSMTAEAIAIAARCGDPLSRSLYHEAGRYLGIAGAAVVNLLNIEAIILAGGMAGSFDLLSGPMREEIGNRAFALPAGRVRIVAGDLGDDAGILGAAALAMESFPGEGL